jgi:hypothetical protein
VKLTWLKYLSILTALIATSTAQGQRGGYMGRYVGVQGGFGIHKQGLSGMFDFSAPQSVTWDLGAELLVGQRMSLGFDFSHGSANMDPITTWYSVADTGYTFRSEGQALLLNKYGGHARIFFGKAPAPIGVFIEVGFGQERYSFKEEVLNNTGLSLPTEGTGQLLSITPQAYYSWSYGSFGIGAQHFLSDRLYLHYIASFGFNPTGLTKVSPDVITTVVESSVTGEMERFHYLHLSIKFGILLF